MFSLITGLFSQITKSEERKHLLVGPESSGKTVNIVLIKDPT